MSPRPSWGESATPAECGMRSRRVGGPAPPARAPLRAAELRRRLNWASEAERAGREAAVVAERRSEHAGFEPSPAMASLRDRLRDLDEERERRAVGLDAGAA